MQPKDKGVVAVYRTKRQMMLANLLGGMSWGVGSVIGATLVVAIILFLLNTLGGLPIIGSYIQDIADSVSSGMKR